MTNRPANQANDGPFANQVPTRMVSVIASLRLNQSAENDLNVIQHSDVGTAGP